MKKRVLSMLLVLVMMVGLFPATAFAEEPEQQPCTTEGCEYILGHEGDCSNYVTPVESCGTVGCTYTAGHEGNCSNFVACPVMGCLLAAEHEGECKFVADEPVAEPSEDEKAAQAVIDLIAAIGEVSLESESAISVADTAYKALTDAQKALVTNLDVLNAAKATFSALSVPAEIDNSTAEGINLTLTVSNQGVLALVKGSFAAKDMNDDGIITYDEAMWAAHEKYYPGGYEVDYESVYGATVMKVWGAGGGSNANALFIRNGIPLTMNVADTEASVVSEGDALYVSVNVSEMGTDWYTYFDKEYLTVNAGQEFALTLSGFLGMTWGDPVPAVVPGAMIGIWDGGNFSAIDGKTTDSNGKVSLSFDTAGTYVVSASGSIYDEMWYSDCPLMAPYCVVTVKSSEVAIEAVSLDKSSLELTAGNTETLTATVAPDNATDKTVTWTSDNEAVATVADGVVTAVAAGTATITAKAGEKTATCVVTVSAAEVPDTPPTEPVPVETIALSEASLELGVGKSETLTASVGPENATDKTVTWTSSDEAVAKVDENGIVTAVTAGTATITAKAGEITASCKVTVIENLPTLSALKFSASSAATSVEYVLEPAFDPAVREYTVIVPDNTTQFFAWATLGEGLTNNPKIKIKYLNTSGKETTKNITSGAAKGVSIGSFLKTGHDVKELSVLIADETAYTVKVVRKSQLKGITLSSNGSEVPLTPAFSNTTTEYSATVAYDKELTLGATATFSTSTFTVNGQAVDAVNKAATVSFIPQWDENMSSVVTVVAGSSVEGAIPTEYTIKLSQRATKIEIQTPPEKTAYKPGEKFDPTGMTLLATYSDASTKIVSPDAFSYHDEALTSGKTSVAIGYDGLTVELSITVSEAFAGSGTSEEPFLIETADDLVKLSELVAAGTGFAGEYFKMVNPIELPANWSPIGSSSTTRFKGVFDGNSNTLTVPAGGLPLFGYVGGATIKNLSIYGTQIAGYGLINNFVELDENAANMGVTVSGITLKSGSSTLKSGLLGSYLTNNPYGGSTRFSEAHISNCTIESGVVIGYNKDQSHIGSIAGRMQGSITNCTSSATVYGVDYVGGILGCRDNSLGSCSISGSSFGGSVVASGTHAGGILGGGYVGFTATVEASAPNGNRTSITGCTVTGSVSGTEKVGGIIGGDSFVAQTWAANSVKNNSFTGSVSGSSYVGGIIGYYLSLNKFDDIANNYYSGASTGIGFVKYVDTSCTTHETASGAEYFNTESGTSGCPSVTGSHWKTGLNRTDDPLGADKAKLCYTDADIEPVATELKVSGTFKTEYTKGDELDLSGIVLTVNYNKGDPKTIELKDVTVTGYDKTKLGDQQLTISYEGLTAFITVNVKSDKEEITVTVSILGDSFHGDSGAVHTLAGGNLSTWVSATKYTVDSNATAWDVIKKCLDENGYSYSNPTGNYISAINGLAEFSNGKLSGWMYTLNGGHSSLGVSEQYLEDGDVIVVHYSDDYTIDDPMGRPNDTSNAAAVEKLIKEIGTVSLDSKSKIEAARKAYDALSYADKQKVSNYSTLTAAEAQFAKLKEENDKKYAEEVKTLIASIGKFDDNYEKRVEAARKAYNSLTDDQKELVDNYDLLVQAEKLLATKEDNEAAEHVEKLIKLIGKKVSLESKDKIELARKAYDLLTEKQKNLVDNYDDLKAAEEALARCEDLEKIRDAFDSTGDYLEKLGTPVSGDIGGEWMALGLARNGKKVDEAYYDSVVKFVQENANDNQQLHRAKSSENSRVILALTAMGKDVTNVAGHNLLTGLTDMDYLHKQGINGPIWALIAFDSGNYPIPDGNVSREALVDTILDAQLADGGWALAGEISDPDMTGMALTALAPYVKGNKEVKKAVDEAVKALSMMQSADGGFSSIDGSNSESCAQVIVALSALGIDADTDQRFVKNGVSVLDALYSFAVEGGGFRHLPDGKLNGMATEQAYYALTAYFLMQDGKPSLYDMTDIIDMGGDKKAAKDKESKNEKPKEDARPVPSEVPEANESTRPSFWKWLQKLFS